MRKENNGGLRNITSPSEKKDFVLAVEIDKGVELISSIIQRKKGGVSKQKFQYAPLLTISTCRSYGIGSYNV